MDGPNRHKRPLPLLSYPTGVRSKNPAAGRPGAAGAVTLISMLQGGSQVPDVLVWGAPREEGRPLREALGPGLVLLCFYVWDWSPT